MLLLQCYLQSTCFHCLQCTHTLLCTATSSLDITSGVLSFMAQSMVHSNESVQSPNRISVTFSWDIPTVVNCEIINYTLRWSGITIGSAASSPYVWLNASAYLSPFTQYSFTITPVTIIGDGDTQTVSITTVADSKYMCNGKNGNVSPNSWCIYSANCMENCIMYCCIILHSACSCLCFSVYTQTCVRPNHKNLCENVAEHI